MLAVIVSPDQNVAQVCFLVALILFAVELVVAIAPPRLSKSITPIVIAALAFLAAGLLLHA